VRGGPEGDRTPYLFYAIEALYQLSYRPSSFPIKLKTSYYIYPL
jgi:hypothetical protein